MGWGSKGVKVSIQYAESVIADRVVAQPRAVQIPVTPPTSGKLQGNTNTRRGEDSQPFSGRFLFQPKGGGGGGGGEEREKTKKQNKKREKNPTHTQKKNPQKNRKYTLSAAILSDLPCV